MPQDIQDLKHEIFLSLKEPFLPIPSLRRESNFFPTILQDLIGNAFSQNDFEAPYCCNALENLKYSIERLEDEFLAFELIQEFSHSRWLLKASTVELKTDNCYNLCSRSTSAETDKNPSVLISLMKAIKTTIKTHCKAVLAYLQTFRESLSFLSAYNLFVIFMQ